LRQKFVADHYPQTHVIAEDRLWPDEREVSDHRCGRTVEDLRPVCSRQFYQPAGQSTLSPRTAAIFQRRAIVADTFAGGFDTSALAQPIDRALTRTTRLADVRQIITSTARSGRTDAQRISRTRRSGRAAKDQRPIARPVHQAGIWLGARGGFNGRHRLGGCLRWLQKKETQTYTAERAAMGMRTYKPGQSRWYVGYKKHTLRLWWREHTSAVRLVPLVSWVTPANVFEGALLIPSLIYCRRRWSWWPKIVVADMSYMGAGLKAKCRKDFNVAVITRLHSDAKLSPPYVAWNRAECHQGEPLQWLEYAPELDQHWFGVGEATTYCSQCWEASSCPRQFAFAASQHETLFGLLPLTSRTAQRLLQQVRPWIEPAQSYEKNQLGLNAAFLNSLRLTWSMALLADAAVLLRTHAALRFAAQPKAHVLEDLAAHQSCLDFGHSFPIPS